MHTRKEPEQPDALLFDLLNKAFNIDADGKIKISKIEDSVILDLNPAQDMILAVRTTSSRPERLQVDIDITYDQRQSTLSNATATTRTKKSWRVCCKYTKIALLPALIAAFIEVADVMTSLIGAERSMIVVALASVTAFLTSFGLTGAPSELGFAEICHIIQQGGLPTDDTEEWPILGYYQELVALIGMGTMTSWAVFSKFTQAYYIMNTLPGDYSLTDTFAWKIISSVFAIAYLLTGMMTESLDAYKALRKFIVGENNTYASKLGKGIGLLLGGFFAVVNAVMDSTQAIATIADTYKINRPPGFWMIVPPAAIFDGGQKLAFEGRTVVSALDEFVAYCLNLLSKAQRLERKALAAFMVSLILSLFLEGSKQAINLSFLQTEAGDFLLNRQNPYIAHSLVIFSWLSFAGGVFIGIPSLYPELKMCLDGLEVKIALLKHSIIKLMSKNTQEWGSMQQFDENSPLIVNNRHSDLHYQEQNPHLMFSRLGPTVARPKIIPSCGII